MKDKKEAEAIRTGLVDPSVRAFVVILGVLNALTPRARARVMNYVSDRLEEEEAEAAQSAISGGSSGIKEVKA